MRRYATYSFLSRENFRLLRNLYQQNAHLVDIAHQDGYSERTLRRHLTREEAPTGRLARAIMSTLHSAISFRAKLETEFAQLGHVRADGSVHQDRGMGFDA